MQEVSMKDLPLLLGQKGYKFLYLYTPLCGTCQLAGKILHVVEELLPNENWGKINLNFIPDYARDWSVESVPCLLILFDEKIYERIYAFHSVPYLYEKINGILKTNT